MTIHTLRIPFKFLLLLLAATLIWGVAGPGGDSPEPPADRYTPETAEQTEFGEAGERSTIEEGGPLSPEEIAPAPGAGEEIVRFSEEMFTDRVRSLQSHGPLNSIVISQNGEIISAEYFGSMHAGRTHNVKSVSKSILSILVGIAIDQGYLEGVDQTIESFFSDYFDRNPDSEKASITIGDMLTMQTGMASTSGRHYGRWVLSSNWVEHALNRPLTGVPGEDRVYSTGTTHLLGVIVARASGMDLRTFANRYLFGPLDIRIGGWDRDPQGHYMGGNNMALRPADLVKIGRLMINVGEYEGEQLVSREWVQKSVRPYTGRGNQQNYGYAWFRRTAGEHDVVYAWGNGGQFLKILPALDAVIAITSREGGGATRQDRFDLYAALDEQIVPMLEARLDR